MAASAFFNRARTVSQFFRSSVEGAVHQIVLQRFAENRHILPALKADYLKSVSLLTAVSWPSLAWLYLTAEPFTLLLFGEAWIATAELIQWLAVAGAFYSVTAFSRQLHAAMEDTSMLFQRDAWLQIPLLIAVVTAAQFSVVAVAAAIAATRVLALGVHMWQLRLRLQVSLRDTAAALKSSVVVAMAVGVAVFLSLRLLSTEQSHLVLVLLTGCPAGSVWAAALLISRPPLLVEIRGFFEELQFARYQS